MAATHIFSILIARRKRKKSNDSRVAQIEVQLAVGYAQTPTSTILLLFGSCPLFVMRRSGELNDYQGARLDAEQLPADRLKEHDIMGLMWNCVVFKSDVGSQRGVWLATSRRER